MSEAFHKAFLEVSFVLCLPLAFQKQKEKKISSEPTVLTSQQSGALEGGVEEEGEPSPCCLVPVF